MTLSFEKPLRKPFWHLCFWSAFVLFTHQKWHTLDLFILDFHLNIP